MECKIVIPSRKRSDIFTTEIHNSIICIDISEKKDYENFDSEIIYHEGLKNLAQIRQFLYKKFGDIFMIDDDIVSVERTYATTDSILTAKEAYKIIQETYYNSKQINAKLWGFNNDPSPTHYNQHKPFMLKGYINGCAIGVNQSEHLFFTDKTTACESHWINLLNAYYYRYNFIDKRFHFRQKKDSTFNLKGGQSGKRTLETERNDTLYLRKMFGNSIQIKKTKNKTLQLHEYQRELNITL